MLQKDLDRMVKTEEAGQKERESALEHIASLVGEKDAAQGQISALAVDRDAALASLEERDSALTQAATSMAAVRRRRRDALLLRSGARCVASSFRAWFGAACMAVRVSQEILIHIP